MVSASAASPMSENKPARTSFHHGITYTSYEGNTFAVKFNTSGTASSHAVLHCHVLYCILNSMLPECKHDRMGYAEDFGMQARMDSNVAWAPCRGSMHATPPCRGSMQCKAHDMECHRPYLSISNITTVQQSW